VDGAADRAGRCKRTEIIAFTAARAAMLEDLWDCMVAGDENEREGLVVPEHHVEAWLQPLDQIGLEQKRLDLGSGSDELHGRSVSDHAGDAIVVAMPPRVALSPLFEMPRLADIEDFSCHIDHAVDARPGGRRLGMAADHERASLDVAQGFA